MTGWFVPNNFKICNGRDWEEEAASIGTLLQGRGAISTLRVSPSHHAFAGYRSTVATESLLFPRDSWHHRLSRPRTSDHSRGNIESMWISSGDIESFNYLGKV